MPTHAPVSAEATLAWASSTARAAVAEAVRGRGLGPPVVYGVGNGDQLGNQRGVRVVVAQPRVRPGVHMAHSAEPDDADPKRSRVG